MSAVSGAGYGSQGGGYIAEKARTAAKAANEARAERKARKEEEARKAEEEAKKTTKNAVEETDEEEGKTGETEQADDSEEAAAKPGKTEEPEEAEESGEAKEPEETGKSEESGENEKTDEKTEAEKAKEKEEATAAEAAKNAQKLAEFKTSFLRTVNSIARQPHLLKTSINLNISDAGYKKMMNDPEYYEQVMAKFKQGFGASLAFPPTSVTLTVNDKGESVTPNYSGFRSVGLTALGTTSRSSYGRGAFDQLQSQALAVIQRRMGSLQSSLGIDKTA